jgi:hypothetical protein
MDRDEFLKKLSELVNLGLGKNKRGTIIESGPVVASLKPAPGACGDCGRITERPPGRVYSYKGRRRTARCLECRMIQNEPGGAFDSYYVFTKPKE